MSTFKGIIAEFPEIRVDYFRTLPGRSPPLACFLSHVHSDHLLGLESLKSPFVYCSPATRELLLRIEKYPHRINFARGILESRTQHYRHLKSLLRPIPLNAPTEIELCPGKNIRVTLFDANHCAGAVMFLIQGHGKAVLYTGDIRAEPWWIDALVRNPSFLPFTTAGGAHHLDKLYLDTTFITQRIKHADFPTKAEGLRELLQKIRQYPENTVFHFHAWTLGYEDVWLALSAALDSQIHVDAYKAELYSGLSRTTHGSLDHYAAALNGFQCGHQQHPGIFTSDTNRAVRIHSCERATPCTTLSNNNNSKTSSSPRRIIFITPILNRSPTGSILPELGAGGGVSDLQQAQELELNDGATVMKLMRLCEEKVKDRNGRARLTRMISEAAGSATKRIDLGGGGGLGLSSGLKDGISIEELSNLLVALGTKGRGNGESVDNGGRAMEDAKGFAKSNGFSHEGKVLPDHIHFPYSRHSSFNELRALVSALAPRDIYPCTVDESTWTPDISMKNLFGDLCSGEGDRFVHDEEMYEMYYAREEDVRNGEERHRGDEKEGEGDSWDGSMQSYHEIESQELRACSTEGDGGAGGTDDEGGLHLRPSVAAYFSTTTKNSPVKRRRSSPQRFPPAADVPDPGAARHQEYKSPNGFRVQMVDGRKVGGPQDGSYCSSTTTDAELYQTVPQTPLHDDSNTAISETNDEDESSCSQTQQDGQQESEDENEDDTQQTISTSAFESQSQEVGQNPRTEVERDYYQQIKRRKRMYGAIGQRMKRGEGVDLGLLSVIRDGRDYEDKEI